MAVCLHVYEALCTYSATKAEEGVRSLGNGIRDSCETPVRSQNQTQVLGKSSKCS